MSTRVGVRYLRSRHGKGTCDGRSISFPKCDIGIGNWWLALQRGWGSVHWVAGTDSSIGRVINAGGGILSMLINLILAGRSIAMAD